MTALSYLPMLVIGFASGVLVSGAVFAFITIVGVVPRLAQKTNSTRYIKVYETAIIGGGLVGVWLSFFASGFSWGLWLLPILGLAAGIFYGCLAMALAEVLNVLPILARRTRLQKGLFVIVTAIAVGKMIGALLYFLVPGFYTPGG